MKARVQNNGQSCIAAKRFTVHTDIYDAFAARFVELIDTLTVGDPTDPATDVGPLATALGRADVEELVDHAIADGATIMCRGKHLDGPGWFYPPTVDTDITRDMQIYTAEVLVLLRRRTERPISTKQSRSRTERPSASGPTPGPPMKQSNGGPSTTSTPDRSSSTE